MQASGVYGRWNSSGMQVIYTGGSIALACLEMLAHKSGASLRSGSFSIATFGIPDSVSMAEVDLEELINADEAWASVANYPLTQTIGDNWLLSLSSAVLKVPSAIIPGESNYLLNVNHPEFASVRIIGVEPFVLDPRLGIRIRG